MTVPSHRSYWVVAPGKGALRAVDGSTEDKGILRAAFSAISPGTERLVGLGRVPAGLQARMACPEMEGRFPFPVKYGYAWVGRDEAGAAFFAMHPHQEGIRRPGPDLLPLPDSLPLARATLVPNLETALNGWWDADPAEDAHIGVVGGGVVGTLLAYVGWRHGRKPLPVIETSTARRDRLARFPWLVPVAPEESGHDLFDLLFHASGAEGGLQWAIDHLAFEGTVVELSWYGDRAISLRLGESFHYDRKRIVASQVATIARPKRGEWSRRDRHQEVLRLLADPALDELCRDRIAFEELPRAMARLYAGEDLGLHPVVTYKNSR